MTYENLWINMIGGNNDTEGAGKAGPPKNNNNNKEKKKRKKEAIKRTLFDWTLQDKKQEKQIS